MKKHKKKNNQFKENTNYGEHRNGRLAQFKNSHSQGADAPNEYLDEKNR